MWHQANPALGDFRSLEEMRAACARAQEIPAQEAAFRRLYLNQWTEQDVRWIALAAWDACQVPVDPATLAGRRCYVGLDLSTTTDLTAAVAVFPDDDGAGFTVLPQFFCPTEPIPQRVTRDRVPYDEWARRGHLIATPGPTVDYEAVRALLHDWDDRFAVRMVAFDPWNATHLVSQLESRGRVYVREDAAGQGVAVGAVEGARAGGAGADAEARRASGAALECLQRDRRRRPRRQYPAARRRSRPIGSTASSALVMALDAMHRDQAAPSVEPEMYIFGPT